MSITDCFSYAFIKPFWLFCSIWCYFSLRNAEDGKEAEDKEEGVKEGRGMEVVGSEAWEEEERKEEEEEATKEKEEGAEEGGGAVREEKPESASGNRRELGEREDEAPKDPPSETRNWSEPKLRDWEDCIPKRAESCDSRLCDIP